MKLIYSFFIVLLSFQFSQNSHSFEELLNIPTETLNQQEITDICKAFQNHDPSELNSVMWKIGGILRFLEHYQSIKCQLKNNNYSLPLMVSVDHQSIETFRYIILFTKEIVPIENFNNFLETKDLQDQSIYDYLKNATNSDSHNKELLQKFYEVLSTINELLNNIQ